MEFKWHFLFGFVISWILVYFFNFSLLTGLIIFFSSWIIDGDHYLWYALEMKDWNPIHGIKWYRKITPKWNSLTLKEKRKFKRGIFIFHSLVFWVILIVLSLVHKFFFWILIGVAIHMVADLIELYFLRESLYNKIFPCYVMKKNKNKKRLKEL